ncbi:MAG: alpha/beta hydrolase [Bacteroidota bacterium]
MLHYNTYLNNESDEWVTFIHGAGGSSSIWFKQIRDFQKHFNVLLIDLRGHGKSKNPIYEKFKKYTFQAIGNEIIEVIDHLNIEKTHFVGISLGTIIARELSERFPEKTASLILGGAVMKMNLRSRFLMKVAVLVQSIIPYLLLYKLYAFIIMPKKSHRESRNLFVREARKLYQKEFQRWVTLASEVKPLLRIFRLKESGIPTLYIMGSQDHMFLPSIKKLVEEHSDSELYVIPDCGHVVNVEQPFQFNQQSIAFLKSI